MLCGRPTTRLREKLAVFGVNARAAEACFEEARHGLEPPDGVSELAQLPRSEASPFRGKGPVNIDTSEKCPCLREGEPRVVLAEERDLDEPDYESLTWATALGQVSADASAS